MMAEEAPFELVAWTVGEPFPEPALRNVEGTTCYAITPTGIQLISAMTDPTRDEVQAHESGKIQIRMLTAPHTLVFLLKLGNLPWGDATYSPHRVAAAARVTPGLPPVGTGWPVMIALVDARTGLVRALHQHVLSNRFSRAVHAAHEKIAALSADDAAHVAEVQRFHRKSPQNLADQAVDRYVQGELSN